MKEQDPILQVLQEFHEGGRHVEFRLTSREADIVGSLYAPLRKETSIITIDVGPGQSLVLRLNRRALSTLDTLLHRAMRGETDRTSSEVCGG